MRESELTTFLVQNLKDGGVKKLLSFNSEKNINLYREVGGSAYIADICISIGSSKTTAFDNQKIKFIAIEVKISDWENGLYQAWRYNNFAEKSFLAIYKPFAKRIDLQEFINNNVGLIIFDENNIEVVCRPKTNKFKNNMYSLEMREKIWGICSSNTQSVCPA